MQGASSVSGVTMPNGVQSQSRQKPPKPPAVRPHNGSRPASEKPDRFVRASESQAPVPADESAEQIHAVMTRAAWHGHTTVVERLLKAYPALYAKNQPTIRALAHHQERYRLMYEHVPPAVRVAELWSASRKGDLHRLMAVVAAGVDVNCADLNGTTALMRATLNGHTGLVHALILEGADVNQVDRELGEDALMKATMLGKEDIVELLLRAGAHADQPNILGTTPLMVAAGFGRLGIVRRLVEAGAAVDHHNQDGDDAVQRASRHGHEAIVRILSEALAKRPPREMAQGAPEEPTTGVDETEVG